MRKINTRHFHRATRTTPREINRQIVLNLVRDHQPISRADLARRMDVGRGMVTSLVNELLAEGELREGETANVPRGRKPKLLHIRSHDRLVFAVDIRFTRTYLMLCDFDGREHAVESLETDFDPGTLVPELAERIERLLRVHGAGCSCEGIGLVVPGPVARGTGRVLHAPQMGWHDIDVRAALEAATGLPVYIENDSTACALAEVWLNPHRSNTVESFVYLTVAEGVGSGIMVNGEVVRGHGDMAGEFGHVPLNFEGPRCLCGARGCWEAYASDLATLARYTGLELADPTAREQLRASQLTVAGLVQRARGGDTRALETLEATGHYLGIGLSLVINAINPARVILDGQIATGWDLVEPPMRRALAAHTLTVEAANTPVILETGGIHPRLRGAAALVVAPVFAAPIVA
ncbi:MAG TPA: ROK family protein [Longimicrobiaceae bacterium]|nr:ROK family protein [Longimicrobiaceae bacterium]